MNSDQGDVELDVRTEQAWAALAGRLSEVMVALEPDRYVSIQVEAWESAEPLDGGIPCVLVLRTPDGFHVEVTCNRYLASRFRLDRRSQRRMRSLGLREPDALRMPNYWALFRLDAVEAAVQVLIRALREGFAVLHPAFLVTNEPTLASAMREEVTDVVDRQMPSESRNLLVPAPGEAIATYADDAQHLQRLVIQALTPMLGAVPVPGVDGAIALQADSCVVFVCVATNLPLVTVHADVVLDVADEHAAVIETGLLNRDTPGVQFSLDHGVVRAQMILPAVPFVPTLLRATLHRMLHVLPLVDKDLARRVGGRVFLEQAGAGSEVDDLGASSPHPCRAPVRGDAGIQVDAPVTSAQDEAEQRIDDRIIAVLDRMHPILGQLMVSDGADLDPVRPSLVARICGQDREVMRKVLRSSLRTETALREVRREALTAGSEDAVGFIRYSLRRSRRVRAAVEAALRRADQDSVGRPSKGDSGGPPAGHDIAGESNAQIAT